MREHARALVVHEHRSCSSAYLAALLVVLSTAGCTAPAPGRSQDVKALETVSRVQALELIQNAPDAERAIQALEQRRLDFPLDATNVEELRAEGAPPEVVLYLKVRANDEWRQRVADDKASAREAGFDWLWWQQGDGDMFSDFAGAEASGRGASTWVARPEPAPGTSLYHALSKPPGPEPFPDPRLEPPLPPRTKEQP
jgi:hypothetical protein